MPVKSSGWRRKGAADSVDGAMLVEPADGYRFIDHLISAGSQNSELFTTVAGTGANVTITSETGAIGIATLSTGTTTTGHANIRSAVTGVSGPGGAETVELAFRFRIPTLSTGTETHVVRIGLGDAVGGDHTDGAYFEIDSNADAQAQCKTANNGSRTTVDSGITIAANTWYTGVILLSASSAIFRIDGAVVATITFDIPAASRTFGIHGGILKSAGTTSRSMEIDYFDFEALYN